MIENTHPRLTVNKVARDDSWFMTFAEFMQGATVLGRNVFAFTDEELKELDEELQQNRMRTLQDWSLLNAQIVGGESL